MIYTLAAVCVILSFAVGDVASVLLVGVAAALGGLLIWEDTK